MFLCLLEHMRWIIQDFTCSVLKMDTNGVYTHVIQTRFNTI